MSRWQLGFFSLLFCCVLGPGLVVALAQFRHWVARGIAAAGGATLALGALGFLVCAWRLWLGSEQL